VTTPVLKVRVESKRVEATDICSFELADPSGKALPPFTAGSHIDVEVRPGLVRPYSLCNDPAESHRYQIGVLRDPRTRGGSKAMHDELRAGDVISKTELTERLYDQDYERDSNVIEVFIGRLRRKLDPDETLNPIETLRGRGYRFSIPRTQGA
jgi:ferredoxin-NADP reductase